LSEKNDFGFKYKVRTFIIFTKAHIKPIVTKLLDFNNNQSTDYQLFMIKFCDIIKYYFIEYWELGHHARQRLSF